jgi:hypothetical protein
MLDDSRLIYTLKYIELNKDLNDYGCAEIR